jgi:hypothetical protein
MSLFSFDVVRAQLKGMKRNSSMASLQFYAL